MGEGVFVVGELCVGGHGQLQVWADIILHY